MSIKKIQIIASQLLPFFNEALLKKSKVGRPPVDTYTALCAILFVLKTSCQWAFLPCSLGCRSTMNGVFIRWSKQEIFRKVFSIIRDKYLEKQEIKNWFAIDTSHRKAPFAKFSGKSPVDRAKRGIKHIAIVDRIGIPLAVDVAPAHVHDSQLLLRVLMQLAESRDLRILAADSAFDVEKLRSICKEQNIVLLSCKNKRRNKTIEKYRVLHRWIVEQFFGTSVWWRGLKICYAKLEHSALGFLQLFASIRISHVL